MTNQTRVVELINQIGNSLDSPAYAEKILTECGKEILQIVGNLEEQVEILKRKQDNNAIKEERNNAIDELVTVMKNNYYHMVGTQFDNAIFEMEKIAERLKK